MTQYVYTAAITVYDPAIPGSRTLYFSTSEFRSKPTDTPPHTPFLAVLSQPAVLKRDLFSSGTTLGRTRVSYGDLILANDDGSLDSLLVNNYSFDGAAITIMRGLPGAAYPSAFVTEFVGTAAYIEPSSSAIVVKLRDLQASHDVTPLQVTKYLGNNALPAGLEGTAELTGKPKPIVLGAPLNVTPVLVNTVKLIYQAHDGALAAINAVYDRGLALGESLFAVAGPVAAGSGNIAVSVDSVKWFVTPNPASNVSGNCALQGVPGTLVMGVTGGISFSTDGTTWTKVTINASFIPFSLAFDGTHYVALGSLSGVPTIYYSTSLASGWAASTHGFVGGSGAQCVCYDAINSQFVAVGLAGQIGTSPTGAVFTMQTSLGGAVNLTAVVMGASLLVTISTSGGIYTSPTGVTWTNRTSPVTSGPVIGALTYGNGMYVAGINSAGKVIYSPDGIAWTIVVVPFTTATVFSAVFVASQFMLGGDNGLMIISPDVINWTQVSTGYNPGVYRQINAIMYAKNLVSIVYANNTDLLDDTKAPNPWCWGVCPSTGYLRLGSPPTGLITCDPVEGATAADRTAAQLWKRVITVRGGTSGGGYSATDITALDALNSAVLGLYFDSETVVSNVLDMIASTPGAWWGVDRTGLFRLVRFTTGSGTPVKVIVKNDLALPLDITGTQDDGNGIPIWRYAVRYAHNYTIQTTDLAGRVTQTRRGILALEWQDTAYIDAAVKPAHPLASDMLVESCFVSAADALTEATRQQILRAIRRLRYQMVLKLDPTTDAIDLGDTVQIVHPRFGLSGGKLLRVIGLEPDIKNLRVTITGLG